jgi:hypothetical protein
MKMMKNSISWIGLALVLLGIFLLLDRLNILEFHFSTIFWPLVMLLGLVGVGKGFADSKGGKIFFGTVFFLYGLYFFLWSSDFLEFHGYLFVSSTFLIIGIAFLMLFINNFRNWFLLIPALFFIGVGIAFVMTELGYLYRWEVWDAVSTYWPLVLVLFGISLILRRKCKSEAESITP